MTLTRVKKQYLEYFIDERGRMQGVCTLLFANGQIDSIDNYVDSQQHGICITYHKDTNQLRTKTTYDRDQLHGKFSSYYKDGSILKSGFFYNNKIHGECLDVGGPKLGSVRVSSLYINGERFAFPASKEERLMLTLKHTGLRFL